MRGFHEKNGVLHADGVPLPDIAKAAGTPTYVYSSAVMQDQYDALKGALQRAMPGPRQPLLCYACKACSNIAVLTHLRRMGAGIEVVSGGELARALRAGFDPKTIVMTGVGKTEAEIESGLKAGILQFNIESLPELERIGKVAKALGKTATVAFRLNPDVAGGGHHKISTGRKRDKFGIGRDRIHTAFDRAKELGNIATSGISMHIGSQVAQVDSFRAAFEKIPSLVEELRAKGHAVTRLDIGGGFPIVYRDEKLLDLDAYAQWVRDFIAPLGTEIIMEPGRYLVGNAAVLLTQVVHVKETADRAFLIVDAAMNDLIRPAMYDAWHGIEPVANRSAPEKTYDVVGPVCETGDTFATERPVAAMKEGDLAVIRSAGAYGASMASNYNTRPLAAEIMVHEGNFTIIRQRQSLEDILDQDIVPGWLANA